MALIICPECKKEVSDLAEVCIHCGYPLKKMAELKAQEELASKRYQLVIEHAGEKPIEVAQRIARLAGIEDKEANILLEKTPLTLISGLTKEEYFFYEKGFLKRGATVACVESSDAGVYDVSEMKIKATINQKTMECPVCQSEVSVDAYKCPSCGHPFKDEPRGIGFWGVVGAILVVILILMFV